MHGCGIKRVKQESGDVEVEAGQFKHDMFLGPSAVCSVEAAEQSAQVARKAASQSRGLLVGSLTDRHTAVLSSNLTYIVTFLFTALKLADALHCCPVSPNFADIVTLLFANEPAVYEHNSGRRDGAAVCNSKHVQPNSKLHQWTRAMGRIDWTSVSQSVLKERNRGDSYKHMTNSLLSFACVALHS